MDDFKEANGWSKKHIKAIEDRITEAFNDYKVEGEEEQLEEKKTSFYDELFLAKSKKINNSELEQYLKQSSMNLDPLQYWKVRKKKEEKRRKRRKRRKSLFFFFFCFSN